MFDIAAEFCFWREQRRKGSSLFCLGLAKTLEVPNTVLDNNTLSFLAVYPTAPNG
jgi:hypothetical protein